MREVPSPGDATAPEPPVSHGLGGHPAGSHIRQDALAPQEDESANRRVVAGMCVVLVALLIGFAGLIRQNDTRAQRSLTDRFETRAMLTATFTHDFVRDLAARQQRQAQLLLADPEVDAEAFHRIVRAFDFEAAVLVDGDGRLLHVWPARPLIGQDMTGEYPHLRAALDGGIGVSERMPSATSGVPIVAIAVPFDSVAGQRVFSGAFSPTQTPLSDYLDSVLTSGDGSAYLVDRSGEIVAASNGADPDVADALESLPVGVSQLRRGRLTAAVAEVPDVPWQVVTVAPTEGLYAPVALNQLAPWALWMVLALSGAVMVVLVVRLGRARAHAAATARTDHLTGLPNRRAMQEALDRTASLSERHGFHVAALMIDLDNFKDINDTYGHESGDLVIRASAAAILDAARDSDIAGRWGGEEFLVLLPYTEGDDALHVAERIRESIARTVGPADDADHRVTVSIGLAVLQHRDIGTMLRDADAALYAAKANGRNRVEVSAGSP